MSKPQRQVELEVALLRAASIIEGLNPGGDGYYGAVVREFRNIAAGEESSLTKLQRKLIEEHNR